jgi:hypothetical protein
LVLQIPATIIFRWDDGTSAAVANSRNSRRRLLDLEKIVFVTDEAGTAPGVLLVSYQSWGVHRDGPGHGPAHLLYNIGETSITIDLTD